MEPTNLRLSRGITVAVLLVLGVGGWLGGTALFSQHGGSLATQAAPSSASAAESPGAELDDFSDAVLSSLGGLLGANLHQAYLNIGILADAVEGKLYSHEEGRPLLDAISALLKTTETQINRLPVDELPVEDLEHLGRFRAALVPLKAQVSELRLYWQTADKVHAGRFQKARQEAQTALEALVGR